MKRRIPVVLLGRPCINKASGLRNGNYIPPRSEIKLTEEVKQTTRSGSRDQSPSNINRSVKALLFVFPWFCASEEETSFTQRQRFNLVWEYRSSRADFMWKRDQNWLLYWNSYDRFQCDLFVSLLIHMNWISYLHKLYLYIFYHKFHLILFQLY